MSKTIYYGFDMSTRKCLFSADQQPAYQDGVIVMISSTEHSVSDIVLKCDDDGNLYIGDADIDMETVRKQAKAKKEQLLMDAQNRLAILCTVNKTRNDPALSVKIAEWEVYIAEVYFIDVSDTSVPWPPMPELI